MRLWDLHSWRYSELSWPRCCATSSDWPGFARGLVTHRRPSQQTVLGCFCDIRSRDAYPGSRMDTHPKSISSFPFYSPVLEAGEVLNATTIQVTAFIYLRDWLVFCERCTQNYCYYIIWGEWGLKLIYLDLSEPAKEFKLFTYTHKKTRPLKATGSSRI